jgi:hypothetical protein
MKCPRILSDNMINEQSLQMVWPSTGNYDFFNSTAVSHFVKLSKSNTERTFYVFHLHWIINHT